MIVEATVSLVAGAIAGGLAGYAAMRLAGQLDVATLAGHEARLKRLEGLEGKGRAVNRAAQHDAELMSALAEAGSLIKEKGSVSLDDLVPLLGKYPSLLGGLGLKL